MRLEQSIGSWGPHGSEEIKATSLATGHWLIKLNRLSRCEHISAIWVCLNDQT